MSSASRRISQDWFVEGCFKENVGEGSVVAGSISLLSEGFQQALRLGSTVVLARILTPDDYGLIAMVAAIVGFAEMFKDVGLSVATVQSPVIRETQVRTLFWMGMWISAALTGALIVCAPAVSWFYGRPGLTQVTIALALGLLADSLGLQHQALLRRRMLFGRLAFVEVISVAVGVAAGITAATLGLGYWSLVLLILATRLVNILGLWITCPWLPGRPILDRSAVVMVRFGIRLTGFNAINYFARSADNLLIGRVWGQEQLGFYSRMYGLLLLPLNMINRPLASVAIPALSRLHDDSSKYRQIYLHVIEAITSITMPLACAMVLMSSDIVLLLFGPQWVSAVGILRWLALLMFIQPIYNTIGVLFVSQGNVTLMFRWGCVASGLIVLSFIMGIPFGAEGVALAYAIMFSLLAGPGVYLAVRGTEITLRDILKTIGPPFIAAVCAGGASWPVLKILSRTHSPLFSVLGTTIVMGVIYAFILIRVFNRKGSYGYVLRELLRKRVVPATE